MVEWRLISRIAACGVTGVLVAVVPLLVATADARTVRAPALGNWEVTGRTACH